LADYGKLTKACPSVTLNSAAVFLGGLSNVIIIENKGRGYFL
jgi:hypothetical protein